jgi:DNA-binding cell septation regulator SpoVG
MTKHDLSHVARRIHLRRGRQHLRGHWPISCASSTALTAIRITPASERDADDGLLAFLDLELDGLVQIDGVTLRMTGQSRLAISFPSRTSRRGTKHLMVRPRDQAARAAIERAIFDAIGIRQEVQR